MLWRSGALGHRPGQSQNNAGCRKHRCTFRACADQPGPPHRCGCGILDPLVFQLGFSRLLPHHLRWNPPMLLFPHTLFYSSTKEWVWLPTTPSTGNPKCYQSISLGGQVDFPQFPLQGKKHAYLQTKVISPSSAIIPCSPLPS